MGCVTVSCMNTVAFDTHEAVKTLMKAGAGESLAEAVVATVSNAMSENVATKADIAELRADMYHHLWLTAAGVVAATVALVKLIP